MSCCYVKKVTNLAALIRNHKLNNLYEKQCGISLSLFLPFTISIKKSDYIFLQSKFSHFTPHWTVMLRKKWDPILNQWPENFLIFSDSSLRSLKCSGMHLILLLLSNVNSATQKYSICYFSANSIHPITFPRQKTIKRPIFWQSLLLFYGLLYSSALLGCSSKALAIYL